VANAGVDDVDRAVGAAYRAMAARSWRAAPTERAALLRRLGDLVKANVDKLAAAEVRDNGKTITEMRGQMRNTAEWYYYYGGLADKIESRVAADGEPGSVQFHPLRADWCGGGDSAVEFPAAPAVLEGGAGAGGRQCGRRQTVGVHLEPRP